MINVEFKNVGQGDSIFLSWVNSGNTCCGIIDCNIYNGTNPILNEVINRKISEIDFIVLSHLHYDHFSGFSELLDYCIVNKIKIKRFLHTFKADYYRILDAQFKSKKIEKSIENFWISFSNAYDLISEISDVTHTYNPIELYQDVFLRFLAPNGKDDLKLSRQEVKYDGKFVTTQPDFNMVATIIEISNKSQSILFTSDAIKNSFNRIIGKVTKELLLIQVPHHGSDKNHAADFWKGLKFTHCPAVYSVGYVKRDKLPKKAVVDFFDKNNFYNTSTNFVHGLLEFYGSLSSNSTSRKSILLNTRSTLLSKTQSMANIPIRFVGDKLFLISL